MGGGVGVGIGVGIAVGVVIVRGTAVTQATVIAANVIARSNGMNGPSLPMRSVKAIVSECPGCGHSAVFCKLDMVRETAPQMVAEIILAHFEVCLSGEIYLAAATFRAAREGKVRTKAVWSSGPLAVAFSMLRSPPKRVESV